MANPFRPVSIVESQIIRIPQRSATSNLTPPPTPRPITSKLFASASSLP
jgi:hypothetical protein